MTQPAGPTRWMLAAALAGLTLAGCIDIFDAEAVSVRNDTGETLHFVLVANGQQYPLTATVAPHSTGNVLGDVRADEGVTTRSGCTIGDVIALNGSDVERARHGPPLCRGDQWVIAPPGPSTPTDSGSPR